MHTIHSGILSLMLIGFLGFFATEAYAVPVSGKVFTDKSVALPFASVMVKGTTIGVTANSEGGYRLDLAPGEYTLICQHVGYERREKIIQVASDPLTINFVLQELDLTMDEIVIKPGGEDPAYAIIRQAIARREFHKQQTGSFQCNVYIKGLIRLRKYPKTFLGQRIDLEDGDTSGNKIIFLSETLARYNFNGPDQQKVEVLSTRVSGQTNGFGFSNPQLVSLYENNVTLSRTLNPRGFVSPIAENALQFYQYKYEGAFFEDGKQVNRIRVTPKRSYEPLFSGIVNILENSWNIHSVDLFLSKSSQLELLQSVRIQQLYVPVNNDTWMLNSQTIFPEANQFGFDAFGHFTTHYSDYVLEPNRDRKFFDRTVLRYEKESNKRSLAYWDSLRPLPLLADELNDFRRKDSIEKRKLDPKYLDSLDRRQNRLTPVGFVLNGQYLQRRSRELTYYYEPFLKSFGFNTVEGWFMRPALTIRKDFEGRKSLSISPVLRYGFGNGHLNPYLTVSYRYGEKYVNEINVSGGKRIYQFNNANPIPAFLNTFQTLFNGYNYLKIYEARFLGVNYVKGAGAGFTIDAGIQFQRRTPLENTDTSTFWGRSENKENLTPNYPTEISQSNISPHEALVATISLRYRPGSRYVELPDRTINIGSKYPLFVLSYDRGINKLFGSDVEFDRWRFSMEDDLNFKLAGEMKYRLVLGGFLSTTRVELPDYQHFNGNRVLNATPYLNSFQLAPYYDRSNMDDFFAIAHLEHHFNGALTNKIPMVRKANLRLVVGTNAFYTRTDRYYVEFFAGIDNIFKIFRFDYVIAYRDGRYFDGGFKLGIKAFRTLFEDD
ncbi:MAG: DUF5686 and carboxypeptidase regulatory-like domain-containing protein [Chitinophagaceae bacterium]|jgi:hypothetical protein|nr:DUF5686 and carboxypeptidase regulatory-like domain-containing protein [Chitinophagaceae bacterium]